MSLKFQKGNVLVWLIVIFLIIGLLIGGLYYYLEIYAPAQYAKKVIPIYDQIRTQKMGTNLTGGGDYEGALTALDQYEQSFTNWQDQLSSIKLPPLTSLPAFLTNFHRSQQIQEDFTKILEIFLSNIERAKKQAQFATKAKELFLLLRPDLTEYPRKAVPQGQEVPLTPPPNTVGEFLGLWEKRIPGAKEVAQDLFSEPIDLGEVSFEELKSLWQETEQGLDALLPFLRKQDAKLSLSEVQKLAPENDRGTLAKVDKIDEFRPLLEKVLIRFNAENLLKFYLPSENSTQSEFNLRTGRLDTALKDIKAKYPQ